MDRRERRRRARERQKLEEKLKKEGLRLETEHLANATPAGRAARALARTITGMKFIVGFVATVLTVIGGWAILRPHISVEPYLPLDPVDPYSTQFAVKNENSVFAAHDINCVCWPRTMESGNGFSVISPGPLPNIHRQIKLLGPAASSTVDCPSVIGGLGSFAGKVLNAELEIDLTYSQYWWPFERTERFPFRSVRDVQGAVHWIHITPAEEKSIFPIGAPKP